MHPRQLKSCARVVEHSIGPLNRVVAGFTGRRECSRNVIHGRQRGVVIVLMARNARRAGEVVVIVDVTVGALPWRNRMVSGQRESGAVVVKGRVEPRRGVVALIAGLREVRRHVVGIRRSLVILQVAAHASIGGEVVIVVDVAIAALPRRNGMHSGQREIRGVVVERRIRPRHGVVTLLAGLREVR